MRTMLLLVIAVCFGGRTVTTKNSHLDPRSDFRAEDFSCLKTGAEVGNFDNFGKISIKSIDFFHDVC